MKSFLIIGLLLIPFVSFSQSNKRKQKQSYAKGTLFGSWGYNRSWYSKSDLNLSGPGYDFTLAGSRATDRPSAFTAANYFNPNKLTIPQYSAEVGYYFWNNFAITFGIDHYHYNMVDPNYVLLSGNINPGVDPLNNWSGSYTNEPQVLTKSTFDYANNQGMDYLKFELLRTDSWVRLGSKQQFVVTSNLGIGLGGVLTKNDLFFAGNQYRGTVSMSGYGASASAGVRVEFFRHFFIQTTGTGGFMHQVNVKTSAIDANAIAKQRFGFTSLKTAIGFFLYVRPTNDCNSCPHW